MPSRLLIVDDDSTLLMALPEAIRLHLPDSVIETATSGHLALERIKAVDYDAVVTDIKMPGMDGLSLKKFTRFGRVHPLFWSPAMVNMTWPLSR